MANSNYTPKLTTEKRTISHAQSKLFEAFCILELITESNESSTNVIDIQTALRGVVALMDDGLDILGEF